MIVFFSDPMLFSFFFMGVCYYIILLQMAIPETTHLHFFLVGDGGGAYIYYSYNMFSHSFFFSLTHTWVYPFFFFNTHLGLSLQYM